MTHDIEPHKIGAEPLQGCRKNDESVVRGDEARRKHLPSPKPGEQDQTSPDLWANEKSFRRGSRLLLRRLLVRY
jgi:hypothetical protein